MVKVELIAYTQVTYPGVLMSIGYEPNPNNQASDELAEFAGRNCYQSFDRPNPATATNRSYLGNIIEQGHEFVFEHASASFYIEASRAKESDND